MLSVKKCLSEMQNFMKVCPQNNAKNTRLFENEQACFDFGTILFGTKNLIA